MSTFEVRVREVTHLEPHPNAERLELIIVGGYKCCVQKGIHSVGDKILYVPEDTVFTNLYIAEKLGVALYLTGKAKNRVKSLKLRGVLSQGIVLPKFAFDGLFPRDQFEDFWNPITLNATSDDIIAVMQLEKYEEPIPIEMAGQIRRWPSFVPKYDIENIKRPESLAAMIQGEEVVATEKLHGTNFTVAWGPGLEEGELAFVCSRNNAIKESESNVYWRAVKKYDLLTKVDHLNRYEYGMPVSIHGEVIGVQDLKYGCVNGDIKFHAFDIMVYGKFVDYDKFKMICTNMDIPMVPELYRGPYDYDTLAKLAEGKTMLGSNIREGLVVKSVVEREDFAAGRVNFKFISEAYLLRRGGTENH